MSDFVRLGHHITIAKGKPPAKVPFDGPGASAYLTPEYLRGQAEAKLAKPGLDAVAVADGDAILLWDGSNAGEFFSGKAGLAASTMARIRADESIHRGYLVHALKHLEPRLKSQTNGTGIPHVDREVLEGFNVFRPAALEQARMAQVLDTLDTTIRQTGAIIEKLKQVKQGLLHDLLTRGIDANGELRPPQSEAPRLYKESPLGWIPTDWEARSFDDLAEFINGNTFDAGQWDSQGLPIIRIQNLNGSREFNFYKGPINARWHIQPGDLLFAWSGQRGMSFGPRIWHGAEGVLNQHIFKVIERSELVGRRFLFELLRFRQPTIEDAAHGFKASFLHVTRGELGGVLVGVPHPEEQRLIAERIEAVEHRIAAENSEHAKWRQLKSGLMDDLLTGRVRVTPLLKSPQPR